MKGILAGLVTRRHRDKADEDIGHEAHYDRYFDFVDVSGFGLAGGYDHVSAEAVAVVLESYLHSVYEMHEVTDDIRELFTRNGDGVKTSDDRIYMVNPVDSKEFVRVWVHQRPKDNPSVVVLLSHAMQYDYGIFPFDGGNGEVMMVVSPNIGQFAVRGLDSVVDDFKALVDDGPYRFRKITEYDGFHVHGNIERNAMIDGCEVLRINAGFEKSRNGEMQ